MVDIPFHVTCTKLLEYKKESYQHEDVPILVQYVFPLDPLTHAQ